MGWSASKFGEKLRCYSKAELIQKARELEEVGCLNIGRECYGCI